MVLILIIAGLLAPLCRGFNSAATTHTSDLSTGYIVNHLHPWLIPLGRIKATNQGEYYIRGYSAKQCNGSIALLDLYRNAEAAHILPLLISGASEHGYIFKARIHQQFPQYSYAIERVRQKFYGLLNIDRAPIIALAFAEFGQCQIAQSIASKIDNSTL